MSTGAEAVVPPRRSREKKDVSIMETNNSSIASKSSVERLYFQDEPQFFRYFVNKPQRRSPAINRGYWLRMKAVDHVVKQYLKSHPGKPKMIVNLGCGYDPLPFKCLSRYPEDCHNVKFVDVDYAPLVEKKSDIVAQTEQMRELLSHVEFLKASDSVSLWSDQYVAIKCDLRDLQKLKLALQRISNLDDTLIFFIAEVSITYMDVNAADSVIEWAASMHNASFCLLEQTMPGGEDHPFAQTMIEHFKKCHSPLQAVHQYPSLDDQKLRFKTQGWRRTTVRSLWHLWSDDSFVSPQERLLLNKVEPFDEWEEFALFASHYLLLWAGNDQVSPLLSPRGLSERALALQSGESSNTAAVPGGVSLKATESRSGSCLRRFGAAFPIGTDVVAFHGGIGQTMRLNTSNIVRRGSDDSANRIDISKSVSARMCHTITLLGKGQNLLVGGRASPEVALADCWLLTPSLAWQQVESLEIPRYRHCATQVGTENVLVFGGKDKAGNALADWVLWTERLGWRKLDVPDVQPRARFGASMSCIKGTRGVLFGGMTESGTVLCEIWEWKLDLQTLQLSFQDRSHYLDDFPSARQCYGRFGAAVTHSPWGLVVVGGIAQDSLLEEENEIMIVDIHTLVPKQLGRPRSVPRLLPIGCAVCAVDDAVLIFGGGAVCFAFGTFWNTAIWALTEDSTSELTWHF